MKKGIKFYAVVWLIVLAVFNVICFVTPAEIGDVNKYETAMFWIGYAGITLSLIGQFLCACLAFRTDNLQKFFYRFSLIKVSYTGLIFTMAVGTATMLLPQFVKDFPTWVGVIVCVLVLAFTYIAVVKAAGAAEAVESVDAKIKAKTQFIRLATVDAEGLLSKAQSPEAKEACKKVFEALRFSDPMSDDALAGEENEISVKLQELSALIGADDKDAVGAKAEELLASIRTRNAKCKALK